MCILIQHFIKRVGGAPKDGPPIGLAVSRRAIALPAPVAVVALSANAIAISVDFDCT